MQSTLKRAFAARKPSSGPAYKRPAVTSRAMVSSRSGSASSGFYARSRGGRRTAQMNLRGFLGAAGDAKYVDTTLAAYALNTTGSVTHVSIVPTGTTVGSRDGKAFRCTSVQVRGNAQADTTTLVGTGAAYLVWDRQPNKALAAVTDILDSASSASLPKRENASRFKILKKWRWAFSGNNTTAGQINDTSIYDVDDYVRLPSDCVATCTAADTTGVIGNRVTGALLLVTVGDVGAGTADANLNVGVRLNFADFP